MTAATPPLVDVIAEVLAYEHCKRVNPKADHPIMGYHTFHPDQREHLRGVQMDVARAVMAAISEAGIVEWGVQWAGEDGVTEYEPSDKATVTSAMKADVAWAKRNALKTVTDGELVSRITFPWERAE